MGAKQTRPQTRKRSSSPKMEMVQRHETRRNNTSGLRIRIPKYNSISNRSNRSRSESEGALHFDKSLPSWPKIERDFTSDRKAEHFIYMFYDPTHGSSNIEDDKYVIPSHEVMAWAGDNYGRLVEFCGNELDGYRAYLRYAGSDEPVYESALLLAIRRDGRILGFAAIEGWDSKYPHLNDICVAKKRRGIGREMIETYLGYAQDNQANELSLDSVTSAVPFYQRIGFDFKHESDRAAYAEARYGQYQMKINVKDYEFVTS